MASIQAANAAGNPATSVKKNARKNTRTLAVIAGPISPAPKASFSRKLIFSGMESDEVLAVEGESFMEVRDRRELLKFSGLPNFNHNC